MATITVKTLPDGEEREIYHVRCEVQRLEDKKIEYMVIGLSQGLYSLLEHNIIELFEDSEEALDLVDQLKARLAEANAREAADREALACFLEC